MQALTHSTSIGYQQFSHAEDGNTSTVSTQRQTVSEQISAALWSLADGFISGYQLLLLIRELGTIEPPHLVDRILEDVNHSDLTEQDWERLLRLSCNALSFLPDHFKNSRLCQTACLQEPSAIRQFPASVRAEVLPRIITQVPQIFSYIYPEEKTHTVVKRLLLKDPQNIVQIPDIMLDTHPDLLTLISADESTWFFSGLPDRFKTRDFCLRFCSSNFTLVHLFKNLPKTLKFDPTFYRECCYINGDALEFVPRVFQDSSLFQLAIDSNPMALTFVPVDSEHYEQLCWKAINKNGLALACVDANAHFADYNFYLEACRHIQYDCQRVKLNNILHYIPEQYRTDELCRLLIPCFGEHSGIYLHYLPESLRNDINVCTRAVACNGSDLGNVPDHLKNEHICLLAANCVTVNIDHIPERLRTKEFYQRLAEKYAQTGECPLDLIPTEQLTVKHCQLALSTGAVKNVADILSVYLKLTDKRPGDALVSHEALGTLKLTEKLALLSYPEMDDISRLRLISHLNPEDRSPSLCNSLVVRERLYQPINPLTWSRLNPFVSELISTSYSTVHYLPPLLPEGLSLLHSIESQSGLALTPIPADEPLLTAGNAKVIGGRTLAVALGDNVWYYKFQRLEEPLPNLLGEGLIHNYMQQVKPFLGKALKSDMPFNPAFFTIDAEVIEQLPEFSDPLEINETETGDLWVNVYRYQATSDYGTFAHHIDSNSDNPTAKPEQGLLKACHDIGFFISMGLIPTSTLPAFHDTRSVRQWMALHSAMGYTPSCSYPGTFEAWNSLATEFPDFGYSGFRDVFDCELFGAIESYIKNQDASTGTHPPAVAQRLMLVNACIENLLAVVMVRSRLHQQLAEYHYKNPLAVAQCAQFVESALKEFVIGYCRAVGSAAPESDFQLQQFICIDEATYQKWLKRAALELVYWTAAQPSPHAPDSPAFTGTTFDHSDCYALHIRQTGRLAPELYVDNSLSTKNYPDNFFNPQGNLSLGANNSIFPLTTLLNGLTLLGRQILLTKAGP